MLLLIKFSRLRVQIKEIRLKHSMTEYSVYILLKYDIDVTIYFDDTIDVDIAMVFVNDC